MLWLRALGLPLSIAATSCLENTRDKSKIVLYTCACQPVVYKRPEKNEEESATSPALTVKGDCVLDFCLEWDSYDSGYCKTIEVF